jgi:adenosylhomocysteine nucleosidase
VPVVAVCGLEIEARLAKGDRIVTVVACGDSERLSRELDRAMALKPSAVISFGISGGLAPGLRPGSRLVARAIVTPNGERYASDAGWSMRLSAALGGAPVVDIAGIDAPVGDPAAKRELHVTTGAAAADMESHVAARVAAAHGLPFAAFRVVLDPCERRLPPAALAAMRPDGAIALGAIARSILRDPSQVPQLVRTASDARAGFWALLRGRQRLAHGLGFTDFRELQLDVPAEDMLGRPLEV